MKFVCQTMRGIGVSTDTWPARGGSIDGTVQRLAGKIYLAVLHGKPSVFAWKAVYCLVFEMFGRSVRQREEMNCADNIFKPVKIELALRHIVELHAAVYLDVAAVFVPDRVDVALEIVDIARLYAPCRILTKYGTVATDSDGIKARFNCALYHHIRCTLTIIVKSMGMQILKNHAILPLLFGIK